jgi:predicted homoserine dehydrogenase-like protein
MIILDKALERRQQDGNPIRIGMVGAGYMGQAMTVVIERNLVGMRVVAIANRTIETAERVFGDAGIEESVRVSDQEALDSLLARGGRAVTSDPLLLCRAPEIEAIIECTGWRSAHRPGRRCPPDPSGRLGPADPHRRCRHARQTAGG